MRRLCRYIIIATIPGGIFGALFEKKIEDHIRAPWIAAIAMIVLALFLLLAEVVRRREMTLRQLTLGNAVVVGISQAAALIPGVSRSGVTITTGLFRGMERDTAPGFHYLWQPLIAGAVLKKMYDVHKLGFKNRA